MLVTSISCRHCCAKACHATAEGFLVRPPLPALVDLVIWLFSRHSWKLQAVTLTFLMTRCRALCILPHSSANPRLSRHCLRTVLATHLCLTAKVGHLQKTLAMRPFG